MKFYIIVALIVLLFMFLLKNPINTLFRNTLYFLKWHLSLRFVNFVIKYFHGLNIFIIVLGVISLGLGIKFSVYALLADEIAKMNTTLGLFSISAGIATILGVLIALAQMFARIENITRWDDLLSEIRSVVVTAEEYIVMMTYYPTIGMISMKKSSQKNDYHYSYKKFIDAINNIISDFNHVITVGIFLEEAKRNSNQGIKGKIENIMDQMKINHSLDEFQQNSDHLIQNIARNTAELNKHGKVYRSQSIEIDCEVKYHVIFSEHKGVIFIPLTLDGKATSPIVEFIGNATIDQGLIRQFQKAVNFYVNSNHVKNLIEPAKGQDLPF